MKLLSTVAASAAALVAFAPQSFAQDSAPPPPSVPRAPEREAQSLQPRRPSIPQPPKAVDQDNCPHPDALRQRNWVRSGTLQPRECVVDRIAAARDRASSTIVTRLALDDATYEAEQLRRLELDGAPMDPAERRRYEQVVRDAEIRHQHARQGQEHTRLQVALEAQEDITALSEVLQRHYELRADRQQRFLDSAAGVTFWTGLGAGLSGRVGVATQRAWLGAAFFPLLATQQNNNEPTRDIYFAGALGMDLIDQRYETIMRATDELRAFDFSNDSVLPSCYGLRGIVFEVGGWQPGDHRSAILPEAQRMLTQCRALESAERQTQFFVNATLAMQASWTRDYADDLIELDTALLEQDRRFRNTPTETIRLMMGAPFRALDNFLTGQDTNEALGKLKSDQAFNSLTRTLSSLSAPVAPQTVETIQPLSAPAWTRVTITSERPATGPRQTAAPETQSSATSPPPPPPPARSGKQPTDSEVATIVNDLDYYAGQLMIAQERQTQRGAQVALIREAVASNHLEFKFDTASRLVQITLGPPPPPPPATTAVGNTGTGASTGASSTPATPPATPAPGAGGAARQ